MGDKKYKVISGIAAILGILALAVSIWNRCEIELTLKRRLKTLKERQTEERNNITRLKNRFQAQSGTRSTLNNTVETLKQNLDHMLSTMDALNRSINYSSATKVQQLQDKLSSLSDKQGKILKLLHLNDTEDHVELRKDLNNLNDIVSNVSYGLESLKERVDAMINDSNTDQHGFTNWQTQYFANFSRLQKRVTNLEHDVNKTKSKANEARFGGSFSFCTIICSIALYLGIV